MTSSPFCTESVRRSPLSVSLPGPTANTRPRCGFCLAVSGNRMPPAVFSSASNGSTTTRSSKGRIRKLISFSFAIVNILHSFGRDLNESINALRYASRLNEPLFTSSPCHPCRPYHPYHPYHPCLPCLRDDRGAAPPSSS